MLKAAGQYFQILGSFQTMFRVPDLGKMLLVLLVLAALHKLARFEVD